ncbi:aspartate 1-decarboxylase [Fastidiosibacter lacustris]|nr:aspartate 1-decarboxylase [Fastidiosibacter lacustris]
MKRTLLKSKIHMATVTEANLRYYGAQLVSIESCANRLT